MPYIIKIGKEYLKTFGANHGIYKTANIDEAKRFPTADIRLPVVIKEGEIIEVIEGQGDLFGTTPPPAEKQNIL